MKIVIPMLGRGSRFLNAGITTPKVLINIKGKWMVEWAMKSLPKVPQQNLIFVCLSEHERKFEITKKLKEKFGKKINVILHEGTTEGMACSVLLAEEYINNSEDLLIHSADTYVISDIANAIREKESNVSGIISTIHAKGDRWSFVKLNKNGDVIEVAEKVRISDNACTGMYYFSHGKDFVWAAKKMIKQNLRYNNEFYVAPVYNQLINRGDRIITNEAKEMWELGTPESLNFFLKNYGGE